MENNPKYRPDRLEYYLIYSFDVFARVINQSCALSDESLDIADSHILYKPGVIDESPWHIEFWIIDRIGFGTMSLF
jgi:hypothetical protein